MAARSRSLPDRARPQQYLERVDERDHVAVAASLRPFFAPAAVAVIGASPRRGSIGGELFRNILAADFAGAAFPVNRAGEPVAGVRGYASIAEIPDPIDLAVICVPGEPCSSAAEEALASGVRALCVISAGFAEVGPEGGERQEQLLALVRAHGARLIGPNCLGIAVAGAAPERDLRAASAAARGTIGFSSQSGALGLALLEAADARGLGLSAFVSIGNKADVSSNDLLEYWEDDESTDLVAALPRVVRQPAQVRPHRAPRRAHEADPRDEERAHVRGRAGGELAHRRARRLGRGGRRAVPPGGRDPRRDARGAARRRGAALDAAAAARPPRRRADERGRARDPLRRRVRGRRARAARRSPTRPGAALRASCRPRRASRTPSTCSARRRPRRTRRRCRLLLATPASTR